MQYGFWEICFTAILSAAVTELSRAVMATGSEETAMWIWAICSTTILSATVTAQGAPWLGPDRNSCRPVTHGEYAPKTCCELDASRSISDFKFDAGLPVRTRRPTHKFDGESLRKYERAFALMRALPDDDPRSLHAQSKLHCGWAMGSYNIANSTDPYPVHTNWHFTPFHRWFLYFYERILAKLVGDDTLAIPYWAWDVQNETAPPANVIPAIFNDPSSPLFDSKRTVMNQPPARVNLDLASTKVNSSIIDPEVLVRRNYNILWQNLKNLHPLRLFYGDNTTEVGDVMGSFELFHLPIHPWTGADDGFHEDMGPAYSSASDPIFVSHHAQTDRMWEIWRTLGGGLLDDSDWLDSEYLFYDENADLVRVRVRDCLDNEKLRVAYEDLTADWLDYEPTSIRERGEPKYARLGPWARLWRIVRDRVVGQTATAIAGDALLSKGEKRAGSPSVTYRVTRSKAKARAGTFNEVLMATMVVTKPSEVDLALYVFVELPEADETTPRDCVEFVGGVFFKAREGKATDGIAVVEYSRKFAMGDRLRILGVSHYATLDVTFVPSWDRDHESHATLEMTELKLELHAMPVAL